jgi:TonB-dependent SusC/RagA subfamily outer membrane receptor
VSTYDRSAERESGAYGEAIPARGEAVGAVSTVRKRDRAASQVGEMIEISVPGAQVVRTASGGFLIRIRGAGSFLGSEEPLYVIDGMPVHVDPQRGLDWLSPHDIERVTVLKGPPETSLYGVRGANGVVVITTRLR